MKIFLFFLLYFPHAVLGQCGIYYAVSTPTHGKVRIDEIESTPLSIYSVDFTAYSAPDSITIIFDDRSFGFYIGDWCTDSLNCFVGFSEFVITEDIDTVRYRSATSPPGFFNVWNIRSSLRLWIYTPQNSYGFKIKTTSNLYKGSDYVVCINLIKAGSNVSYTMHETCDDVLRPDSIEYAECGIIFHKFISHRINDVPVILHPSCADSSDGAIKFPNHPEWDKEKLSHGSYKFSVTNGFCNAEYLVELESEKLCNNYYIPNITQRDEFWFYTRETCIYTLEFWSRWGELAYREKNISNTPVFIREFPPRVYTYRIQSKEQTIVGTFTKI